MIPTPHAFTLTHIRNLIRPYGATFDEVLSPRKSCELVMARWTVMHYLKYDKGWSTNRIATFMNRDHSSVKHALDTGVPAYYRRRCQAGVACPGSVSVGGNHAEQVEEAAPLHAGGRPQSEVR